MNTTNNYKPHDHNAVCDVCGCVFKASQLRKRWDGFMVCKEDWEPKHLQLSIKSKPENVTVKWSRPEPVDTFRTPEPVDFDSL